MAGEIQVKERPFEEVQWRNAFVSQAWRSTYIEMARGLRKDIQNINHQFRKGLYDRTC